MTVTSFVIRFGRGCPNSWRLLSRFVTSDSGQDTVEYALLAAFVGVAGWAVLSTIDDAVKDTYNTWLDPTSGVPSKWEPPEPSAS
jgi:Flp pilus assembly pilin Flp